MTPSSDGLISVNINGGVFTDLSGNSNTASSPFLWNYDGTSPTISISSSDVEGGLLTNDNSVQLTFLTSETVNDFDSSDITFLEGRFQDSPTMARAIQLFSLHPLTG